MMQNPEAINNAGRMSNVILVLIENRINGRSRSYTYLTVLSAKKKKSSDMLEKNMTVRRFLEEYYQKVMKLVPVPFYGLKV